MKSIYRIIFLITVILLGSVMACENPFFPAKEDDDDYYKYFLFFKPKKTFTVTFNSNDGTPVPEQIIARGGKVVEPEGVTKTNHNLAGWYRESGFINKWNFDEDTVTADITLHAKWNENPPDTHTVTFITYDGTPHPENQLISGGGKVTRPQSIGKENHTFGGWYTDEDLETEWDFDEDIVTGDVILHAKWLMMKTDPDITWPAEASITYGQTLADAVFIGGIGDGAFAYDNSTFKPSVAQSGTEYKVIFTPADTTNYNSLEQNIAITVNRAVITNADVGITGPVKNGVPAETIHEDDVNYTCENVTWTPSHAKFLGGIAYTVTIVLEADANHVFADPLAATINHHSVTVTNNTGSSVTLSHQFGVTDTRTVTDIAVKEQPAKLTYTHGEELELSGLEVTLSYDDGSSENVLFINFNDHGIETDPEDGTELSRSQHNGSSIEVSCVEVTTNTANLTVSKADPVVAWPTATAITYGEALSTSALIGGSGAGTFAWTDGAVIPTVVNSGYEVTFTPTDTANYNTLTQNLNITVDKATLTVTTWPTATAITYGAALSTSALTGGSGGGSFAWTDGTIIPTVINSGYEVTFTPTDTANYNTLTQNVNITVNKATPTVTTWPSGLTATYGQTLANVSLSGFNNGGAGSFAWTIAISTSVGNAGTKPFNVTYTPNDSINYNTVTQDVSITIDKATPTVTTWPTSTPIVYGAAISTSTLIGGAASVDGSFAWTNSNAAYIYPTDSYQVTFTPNDTINYETLTQMVSITAILYTITFNTKGGTPVPSQQTVSHGNTVNRPQNPTLSGYTFHYWCKDENTTVIYYFDDAVTENLTLYAKWLLPTEISNIADDDMVWVAGGSFQMGQNGDGSSGNETPVHTVTLSGFYISKYEVTQGQYQTIMGTNPSNFTSDADVGENQSRRPVERVTWYDAVEFCNKLSETEGLTPVYKIENRTPAAGYPITNATVTAYWSENGYRLPTEAQWEYAAKGGTMAATPPRIYSGSDTIEDVAWYSSNSYKTHEVGKKQANELGLYDMSGNVFEWCWDWHGAYSSDPQNDPLGASSGSSRVGRGGSWLHSAVFVRSAFRHYYDPIVRYDYFGFRVVRP